MSLVFLSFSATFLAEVLLGMSLSAEFLGLFSPPCVLGALPDSGEMSPWIVAFLFTEERVIAPSVSSEGEGGVEIPALDCPGVFPAGHFVTVLPDLLGLNPDSISLVNDSGE